VVFDAPASIPHQHGLAETWDLVEERDVTDSFQSLRVEAHHHIGRQAFGVPGQWENPFSAQKQIVEFLSNMHTVMIAWFHTANSNSGFC
jgi:hypothetical protein